MKELKLVFRGVDRLSPTIMVDGKAVKAKKNNYGTKICVVQTEKDQVEVAVYKHLELAGRLWFLMNILYFIISLFGIFDPPYDKKCIVIDCKYNVKVNPKTKVVFSFNALKDKGKAVEVESDTQVEELANSYYVDQKIKKRRKIAIITRILLLVAMVVALVLVLVI